MNGSSSSGGTKVIVITGASAGVGRATALCFARSGAAVALIARDPVALNETKADVEAAGARALALPADVADAEALFAAAREVEAELGPIDVWVNNAMVTVFAPLSVIPADEFRRVTEVTYLGMVHGTMAALRHMQPRNRGVIIQVGSALAYRGIPLQAAYCGAKHAVRGFTDSLRAELHHDKSDIRLVMVQLPAVNTPQFDWARTHFERKPRPVAPVFQPEVAAEVIFKAALSPRREIWLGLSTLKVIVGSMVVPGFLDAYLARGVYSGQKREERVSKDRQDNLRAPVQGLHRTHGSFDDEASDSAFSLSGQSVRFTLIVVGLAFAMIAGAAVVAAT